MYLSNIKMLINLFYLLLSLPNFIVAANDFSFSFTKKYKCPSKYEDCYFNITNSNPYSPKISSSYPEYVKSYDYHFINFIFYIPKSQKQKWFYFEVYDCMTKESLISNGDCHFINITNQFIYQFYFTKHINDSNPYSYIQFRFFGLDPNFFMLVQAEFRNDLYFTFRSAIISDRNSLYKAEQKDLEKYLDELQILESEQRKRKDEALRHANIIAEALLHKSLDTNIQYTENIFEDSIITPFFIVTVTVQTGLELSKDTLLEPEYSKIGEYTFFKNNIEFESLSILDDKVNIDNFLLKIISLFKNKILDISFSFNFESEYFSMTISTNGYNSLELTFKFINPDNDYIYYEIQFKLEIINPKILEVFVEAQQFLLKILENIRIVLVDDKKLAYIIFFLIFICAMPATAPTAIAGNLAFSATQVYLFLSNAIQFPIFSTYEPVLVNAY